MRKKQLKLSAVFLLGLGLTGLQAQTMYVKEKSGTQTAYTLSGLRKMTFSGGNATVQKSDNSAGVYALSGLRYLNFTNLITGQAEPIGLLGSANIVTYPIPVSDVLNIDLTGLTGEITLSILTMEGKEIQTQTTNGGSLITLNVSHLAQGIYWCRYANAVEIKTVKIIKQ
jgi:hypothetical protein